MGAASQLLAELTAKAAAREAPPDGEHERDLLALPSGELVPLFPDRSGRAAAVVAQAPAEVWD